MSIRRRRRLCKTSTAVELKRFFSPVRKSVRAAAQLELADPDGEVDAGLRLHAERLQGESLLRDADQEVGDRTDRGCDLGAGADIVADQRTGGIDVFQR